MAVGDVTVIMHFPDGSSVMGGSSGEVLARLGLAQRLPITDVAKVKERLSDRAWVWSQGAVDPLLPDDEFLAELAMTGMVTVERLPHRAKP